MLTLRKKISTTAQLCVATSTMILSAGAATVVVSTEATIEAGGSAAADEDEIAAGYIFVKHQTTVGGGTRKAYFQFDLTGQDADFTQPATLKLTLQSNRGQALKFWALDDAYTGFASTATWNSAQANELATNDLLTSGVGFTATQLGGVVEFNGSTGDEITVNLTSLAPFVFDDVITLAVSGAEWTTVATNPGTTTINGGMRFVRNNAELEFAQVPEPSSLALLGLSLLMVRRRRA